MGTEEAGYVSDCGMPGSDPNMRDPWLPKDEKDYDPMDNDFKSSNPKDIAATYRVDVSLFPDTAIAYGALGMTEGHFKYGAFNYRVKGVAVSTYNAALRRHIMKYYNGEWEDEKTGVPHLASILSCAAILVDGHELGILIDDRPPRADVSGLLDKFMKKVKHLFTIFPNSPGRYTEAQHGKKEKA